ncbi:MAG: hypothetical protein ACO4CG_10840 [Prochlorothrix sp.]
MSRPGLATPVWSGAVTVLLRHYDAPLGLAFRVLSMIRRSPRPPLQNQAFEQALEELRDKLEGLQQRYESVCAEQVRLAVLAQEIQAATRAQPEAGGAARVNTGKLGLENSNLGRPKPANSSPAHAGAADPNEIPPESVYPGFPPDDQAHPDAVDPDTVDRSAVAPDTVDPEMVATLAELQREYRELESHFEAQFMSWDGIGTLFWQIVRFGGLGMVLGWGLRSIVGS